MYELGVKRKFAAAHQLKGYQGKCEALHGHTFMVEVRVRAEALNDIGLAMDFNEIKAAIDRILERYDHCLLNNVEPFDKINPSSENLARTIHDLVADELAGGVLVSGVTVWESENSWASYEESR